MRNLVIYKSSAGSGKTYTLVKEYIKLVLRSPSDYKHILAVTFTNKATEEMKSRITAALKALAEDENHMLAQQLRDEGITFDIKAQAQKALTKILHDYGNFAVSTIDSFFHRIIRSFAKELNLQLGYDIEMDQERALTPIIDELIADIDTNEQLRHYIEAYVLDLIENDRGWRIEYDIKILGKELFKEKYYELREKFVITDDQKSTTTDFLAKINSVIKQFEDRMLSLSNAAFRVMAENDLTIEDFAYGKTGVANYMVNNLGKQKKYVPTGRALGALADRSKWYSKSSARKSDIIQAVNDGLYQVLDDAVQYFEKHRKMYYTAIELCKTIYIKGILNDLLEKIKEYRDEHNIFFMSDTNIILHSVITGDEAPFVYEKAGSKYKHFLIDEFQDTSTYQWYNLLPLIVNCLASGNYAMFVGDVKQSIYRWRGGNMNLLLSEVKNNLAQFADVTAEEKLITNRRSGADIVKFNNIFFKEAPRAVIAQCAGGESLNDSNNAIFIESIFEDAEQEHINEGGYVNIHFLADTDSEEDPDEEDVYQSVKEKAFKKTYNIITEALADGYSLRDILILVRLNQEASEIASYLFTLGIKVISSESLLLHSSVKIQFIINLFRYLADNRDSIARTHILFYYLNDVLGEKFDHHTIFTDYTKNEDSLFFNRLPQEFTAHLSSLRKYSLYEITEELMRIFGLNKKPDAYLQRFQDMLLEYSGKYNDDILTFLRWWEEYRDKYNVIVPEGEEAVSIMTTHKAKGLEKPVVIIPFADWSFFEPAKSMIWAGTDERPFVEQSPFLVRPVANLTNTYFEKDYYEEQVKSYVDNLNLLYVSFTRASERLYAMSAGSLNAYNTGKLIKETILNSIDLNTKFDLQSGIFEFGKKEKAVKKAKPAEREIYEIKEYIATNWHKKLVIRSKPEELFKFGDSEEANIERITCEALKRMRTADEADEVLSALYAEGIITNELKEGVKEKLTALLQNETVKKFFDTKSSARREILHEGSILKPDRLILNNGSAEIIEFGIDEKSAERMSAYEKALTNMGYKNIGKYFLDIKNNGVKN